MTGPVRETIWLSILENGTLKETKDPALSLAALSDRGQVAAWALLLFALTLVGALPLLAQGLNLSKVSSSTPHLALVMTGMLVISCAPTLAALLVVGFYPGAGGIRSITREKQYSVLASAPVGKALPPLPAERQADLFGCAS